MNKLNNSKIVLDGNLAKKLKIYKYEGAVLAALTVIIGFISFWPLRNSESRYLPKAPLSIIIYIILAIDVIFALSALFVFKRGNRIDTEPHGKLRYINSIVILSELPVFVYIGKRFVESGFNMLTLFLAITALFALLYNSIQILERREPAAAAFFGYFQILFCVIIIAELYLDLAVEMNAPVKLLIEFSAAAIILSTLADIRSLIGRPADKQHVFSKLLVAFLCPLSLISAVIIFSGNNEKYQENYLYYSLFLFAYGICVIVKLISSRIASSPETSDQAQPMPEQEESEQI